MTYSVEIAANEALVFLSGKIAEATSHLWAPVRVHEDIFAERAAYLPLSSPGIWSANQKCRMVRAGDGWMSVNLPRENDLELVPAWIGCAFDSAPWPAIIAAARERRVDEIVTSAQQLGLAVAQVGSVRSTEVSAPLVRMAARGAGSVRSSPIRVIDLSALWAGPLCGAILAEAGADVLKIDSAARPDGGAFYDRLNGMKAHLSLDLRDATDV